MSDIEKKKEYLKGYIRLKKEIKRLNNELTELRIMKMCPSQINDGMPHGTDQRDISDYMAAVDRIERKIRCKQKEAIDKFDEITDQIDRMEDEDERSVLVMRYICGKSWGKIAEEMGYEVTWIYRTHGKALKNFKFQIFEKSQ